MTYHLVEIINHRKEPEINLALHFASDDINQIKQTHQMVVDVSNRTEDIINDYHSSHIVTVDHDDSLEGLVAQDPYFLKFNFTENINSFILFIGKFIK